jgi:hypothetical protein
MKRLKIFILFVIVISVFSIAAANGKQPTGQQIDMFAPATVTLSEGDPFHVTHGWSCGYCKELADYGLWKYKCGAGLVPFTLALEGEEIHFSYLDSWKEKFSIIDDDGVEYFFKMKFYMWTFNFPEGLDPGTYELTGTWHDICENVSDDCDKPLDRVPVLENTITLIVE